MNMVNNTFSIKFFKLFFYFTFSMLILFSRSFVGISILGFRIGEILIGIGLVLSLAFLFIPKKNLIHWTNFSPYFLNLHKVIILSFLLSLFIEKTDVRAIYVFKSSSFIWVLVYFYVGVFLQKYNFFNKISAYYFWLILLLLYFLSTTLGTFPYIGQYPEIINNFFNKYSDKVEPIKASNLLMALLFVNFLIYKYISSEKIKLIAYIGNIGLVLPLLGFNSRGSVIFCFVYLVISIYYLKTYIRNNKIFSILTLLFFVLITCISTIWIFGELKISTIKGNAFEEISTEITSSTKTAVERKNYNPNTFLSFYFLDGRVYSLDGTTDWRLDIWQDSIDIQIESNKLFFGVGYENLLEVMNDPEEPGRYGYDGLNEHVHNYLINVLARGGILLLLITLFFWLFIVLQFYKISNNLFIISIIIPGFLNALIDVCMESVQFPIIFMVLIGMTFNNTSKLPTFVNIKK